MKIITYKPNNLISAMFMLSLIKFYVTMSNKSKKSRMQSIQIVNVALYFESNWLINKFSKKVEYQYIILYW